ncbi:Lipase family protein [Histomonas meleagridis]|uniref:Lipase family protein n=1 Tax=Histomonas meleagridis TaxID=135588 RepID=UPI003559951B|nr:Lipase family protein [Histomonas meleagridis]KAH0806551.1 Lipase family protein [Histomonas meleagridis]
MEKFSKGFEKAKNALNTRKGMKTVMTAAAVASNPKKICFSTFLQQIFDTLPPKEPVEPTQITDHQELKMIHLCGELSSAVYRVIEKRKLIPEAGTVVFDSGEIVVSGVPYFITNSDEMNTIFVVCRGSISFSDYIIDITANAADVFGGLIHMGIYQASLAVCTQIQDLLQQLSHENNHRQIMFTGHSLGAGVAGVCNLMFREKFPDLPTRSIIFAPPAVVSKNLWSKTVSYCTSFFNFGDPIPFLSFHNFALVSSDCLPDFIAKQIQSAYRKTASAPTAFQKVDMTVNPFEAPPPPLESILENNDEAAGHTTSALYPPGKQYIFNIIGEMFCKLEIQITKDCEYFGHFIKELDEKRHGMGHYRECIKEACRLQNVSFQDQNNNEQ